MRLRRLDLIRYGHFADTSLELPPGQPDMYVIYGPNEAGKSTARAALDDLLYGFSKTSAYAFLYEYGALRIGAALEGGTEPLDFVRKKGRKNTILNCDGTPAPAIETALGRALANTDLEFFTRMFSLDQERLRKGATQLPGQGGDGDTGLLAAGTGITDLLARRQALAAEADRLWGPREKKSRAYTQAVDRLKAAEATMREYQITGPQWEKLRKAAQEAQDAYETVGGQRRKVGAEQNRLERIRRVMPHVRRYEQLQANLEALGAVVSLDEDAKPVFDAATDSIRRGDSGIQEQEDRIKAINERVEATDCDDEILGRAEDIDRIIERRARVLEDDGEVSELRAQLITTDHVLRAQAASLGWERRETESLIGQLPSGQELAHAINLRVVYGEKAEKAQSAKQREEDAGDRQQRMQVRLEELGSAVDVGGGLRALVVALKSESSPQARLETAQADSDRCQKEIDRLLMRLEPKVDEDTVCALQLPVVHEVDAFIDAVPKAHNAFTNAQQSLENAKESLRLERHDYEQTLAVEGLVSEEKLNDLRQHRDTGWSLIRSQYIDGGQPGPDAIAAFIEEHSDLADAYESLVAAADEAANHRFDKAEAAGQLKEKALGIGRQAKELEALEAKAQSAQQACERLDTEWQSLWKAVPFEPAPPATMREWLKLQAQVAEKIQDRRETVTHVETVETRLAEDCQRLRDALRSAGETDETMAKEKFSVLMARADALLQSERDREQERQKLQGDIAELKPEMGERKASAESRQTELTEWKRDWSAALTTLGLDPLLSAAESERLLQTLTQLEETATNYNQKRETISQMEGRSERFSESVQQLVEEVARDLSDQSTLAASNELKLRLAKTREARQKLDNWAEELENAKERVEALRHEQREATHTLEGLHSAAGTTGWDSLSAAIERSDKRRNLEAHMKDLAETIAGQGDGLSLSDLMAECAEQTPDAVINGLEEVKDRLNDLESQETEALELRNETQRNFESVGGDDVYANAAYHRSQALSDMREAAETYAKVGTASLLLRWAAQRYRLEKLQPRITRAGEIFAKLTLGSFQTLVVEFDDDTMHIAGRRSNGNSVRSHRMSEGTQDQLFFALRLASLEDYLDHGTVLPFVADDLFVNFDNERALAGLEVLADFSKKTQVLFFTHHQHLGELACEATGSGNCVIHLGQTATEELTTL